jgi:plastocyanin
MEPEIIIANPTSVFGPGYVGTVLLHKDTAPLGSNETRSQVILVNAVSSIGGDIYADKDCVLKVYTSPDGDNYGVPSEVSVAAGETVRFEYPELYSRTVKVDVVNGAVAMGAFRLFVRGGD